MADDQSTPGSPADNENTTVSEAVHGPEVGTGEESAVSTDGTDQSSTDTAEATRTPSELRAARNAGYGQSMVPATGGTPPSPAPRPQPPTPRPRRTAWPLDNIVTSATDEYLVALGDRINSTHGLDLAADLLVHINIRIAEENSLIEIENALDKKWVDDTKKTQVNGKKPFAHLVAFKQKKLPEVTQLGFAQVGQIIMARHHVVNIAPSERNSDPDLDMLAIYEDDPKKPGWGTYQTSLTDIETIARRYCHSITTREFTEMLSLMKSTAPRVTRGTDPDLIAVANGIFNYRTKKLIDFSPDHIFLSKAAVAYNDDAVNTVIHNDADSTDWDVESWMSEFSDDPEFVELLWEIIGAIVRPYVSWNKSAWFYSNQGNNGKGTLVHLMRNICGPQSYASIPIADFGKDFMLEPLTRASAILVDENDVGTFVDKAANLKAVVTNDVISINRKFKTPIAYQFRGFMVQCLNEFPKIKDKSESFYRRQLFVPFTKCFTGAERKYIKDDYLNRDDVLEYVLKRVLNMNYDELSTPAAVTSTLNEYKEFNDPVRAFWKEMVDPLTAGDWDLIPFTYLYDLYKAWFADAMPSSAPVGRNTFISNIASVIRNDSSTWLCGDTSKRIRVQTASGSRMAGAQPLSVNYSLTHWISTNAPVANMTRRATPPPSAIPAFCSGILRNTGGDIDIDDPDAGTGDTPVNDPNLFSDFGMASTTPAPATPAVPVPGNSGDTTSHHPTSQVGGGTDRTGGAGARDISDISDVTPRDTPRTGLNTVSYDNMVDDTVNDTSGVIRRGSTPAAGDRITPAARTTPVPPSPTTPVPPVSAPNYTGPAAGPVDASPDSSGDRTDTSDD